MGIISGNNNNSHIGILQARPTTPNASAFRHKYDNLYIALESHLTANNGLGSICLINISAEECQYDFIELWGNTPLVCSDSYKLSYTNNLLNGRKTFEVQSAFGFNLHDGWTTTFLSFTGTSRICSWDYFSPVILLNATNKALGGIFFDKLFIQKNLPTNMPFLGMGPESGIFPASGVQTNNGVYPFAIEVSGSVGTLNILASVEGCSRLLLVNGDIDGSNIELGTDGINYASLDNRAYPYMLLNSDGKEYKIKNSSIKLGTLYASGTFIGTRQSMSASSNLPSKYQIQDSKIFLGRQNLLDVADPTIILINNPYTPELVEKGIFRNSINTDFKIIDKEIKIGENSLTTKVKKSVGNKNIGKNLIKIEMPSIVIGQNSFSGVCKIEGVLTNSNKTNTETASANFVSTFSFSTNASTLSVSVSPVVTTITSSISTNTAVIDITGLNYTVPVVNYKPDAFQLPINITPVTTGTSTEEIFLTSKVEIFYSDAAKDNIVIDF